MTTQPIPPKTSTRRRENTHARLIEAATTVFVAKGFEGAKIDDLVREAGFTRGAFYSNFSSMDEVILETILQHGHSILHEAENAINQLESPLTIDSIVTVLEALRSDSHTVHILSLEYTLYRLRHPQVVGHLDPRRELNTILGDLISTTLQRMGRTPIIAPESLANTIAMIFLDSLSCEAFQDNTQLLSDLLHSFIMSTSTPTQQGDS